MDNYSPCKYQIVKKRAVSVRDKKRAVIADSPIVKNSIFSFQISVLSLINLSHNVRRNHTVHNRTLYHYWLPKHLNYIQLQHILDM